MCGWPCWPWPRPRYTPSHGTAAPVPLARAAGRAGHAGYGQAARPRGAHEIAECCVPQRRDVRFLPPVPLAGISWSARTRLPNLQKASCVGSEWRSKDPPNAMRGVPGLLVRRCAGARRDRGQSLCAHTHGAVCVAIAGRHDARCTAARLPGPVPSAGQRWAAGPGRFDPQATRRRDAGTPP